MRVQIYTANDTEELELTEEEFKQEIQKFLQFLSKLADLDDEEGIVSYEITDDGVRAWFIDPKTGKDMRTIGGVVKVEEE